MQIFTATTNDERDYSVMLVDDDQRFRDGTRRLLWLMDDFSPRILEAAAGSQALQQLRCESVDCMLLDHRMPGGNGVDWIGRFLAQSPDLAIIVVTGEGDEETAVSAMKNGALDYLTKGAFTLEKLQYTISKAREKIEMRRLIEEQRRDLLDAERQRVMMESLGAACHRLGQPATVLCTYLELMKKTESAPETAEMIDECLETTAAMRKILRNLQQVNTYRTESYLPLSPGEGPRSDERIIAV